MGELITLQIGSFANFVGSHYWNLQVGPSLLLSLWHGPAPP
jgi:hypothetical protein